MKDRPPKTAIYCLIYGGGDTRLGEAIGSGAAEGRALRQRFMKAQPAYAGLVGCQKAAVKDKGYLVGLDGRHLPIRSDHAALNTLLQSAGALICKKWMQLIDSEIKRLGIDAQILCWSHDELQIQVRKGKKKMSVEYLEEWRQKLASISKSKSQSKPKHELGLAGLEHTDEELAPLVSIYVTLDRAWRNPFTTKSDYARYAADLVAICASEGLISTKLMRNALAIVGSLIEDGLAWMRGLTMRLLLDTDILLYKAATSAETEIDWGEDIWTLFIDLKEAKASFMHQVEQIKKALKSDDVICCLTDHKDNFRKQVDPTYKNNRKGTRKPVGYVALADWVRETFTCISKPSLEADDVMSILATKPDNVGKCIIVSDDKDMKSTPCKLYRPTQDERLDISEADADRFFLTQCLTGDPTDGYAVERCGHQDS